MSLGSFDGAATTPAPSGCRPVGIRPRAVGTLLSCSPQPCTNGDHANPYILNQNMPEIRMFSGAVGAYTIQPRVSCQSKTALRGFSSSPVAEIDSGLTRAGPSPPKRVGRARGGRSMGSTTPSGPPIGPPGKRLPCPRGPAGWALTGDKGLGNRLAWAEGGPGVEDCASAEAPPASSVNRSESAGAKRCSSRSHCRW